MPVPDRSRLVAFEVLTVTQMHKNWQVKRPPQCAWIASDLIDRERSGTQAVCCRMKRPEISARSSQ